MTKSLFRALALLTGAAALAFASLGASAATLTYNDPNCAGFQITGSGGSFTLTCAKLSCSISGATNPTTSQDTSLTATCTPAGAGYTWSLVTGPFSDASCSAPSSPTLATTAIVKPAGIAAGQSRSCLYQVTATAPGLSGQAMATVTWSDAPKTAPVCTPSGVTTPTPITSAGGTVALSANCTPSAGVTYSWTRTAPTASQPTNPTTATPSDTLAANTGASGITYTWQVVACTSPTTCDTKSVTVVVPAPGGGTGAISCSGFTNTILFDIPWGTPYKRYLTSATPGGFTNNTALVIRFGAPAGTPNAPNYGSISGFEYATPKTTRTVAISTNPCDWTNTVGSPYYLQTDSTSWDWSTVLLSAQQFLYHEVRMVAGTTYYLNVRNTNSAGAPSCTVSACDMAVDWNPPH